MKDLKIKVLDVLFGVVDWRCGQDISLQCPRMREG